MRIIIIICIGLWAGMLQAQTILMPTSSGSSSQTITCGSTYNFYDSGGSTGDYANNEGQHELTLCPSDGTMAVEINITSGSYWSSDNLGVFSGTNTSTPINGDIGDFELPIILKSQDASGCLTVLWESNGSLTDTGWEATITCSTNICGATDAPEDYCDNAPLVDLAQAFIGSTDCSYTESDASGDGLDPTGDQDPVCGGVSLDNTSWLSFIAAATDVTLDWEISGGTSCTGAAGSTGIQLGVFEGNCGSLTFVGGAGNCLNPSGGIGSMGQFIMSSLTIGSEYYLMIDGYAGDLCDYNITPVAGVAINPDNDDCADATTLTCGGAAATGDILLAGNTDAPNACPSGGGEQDGVWFTFTGDGGDYTLVTTGSNFETDLNVYYSTDANPANYCNTLVCETSYTGSATEATVTFTTVNGRVYYAYLDGKSGAEGSYSIALTCTVAPSCDADAGTWN